MADIAPLVKTEELNWSKLKEIWDQHLDPKYINLDEELDELVLLYVEPGIQTFVHYVESDVALICTAEELDVVGFQIEGFRRSFLQNHRDVTRALETATRQELAKAHVAVPT
jgi:hypothetical protein